MSFRSSFLSFVLALSLSVPVSSQAAHDRVRPAELSTGESWVQWSASLPADNLVLTVSGPDGLYLRQEQSRPRFEAVDEKGVARPNGRYDWELVVQIAGQASEVLSGSFILEGGRIINGRSQQEQPAASVAPGAPPNSVYVDRAGRVGIGTSVPGAQLHVKGTGASLAVEDTQAGGHEYRLRSKEPGDGSLGLFDETNGETRWLIDGEGRMGINTPKPTARLTVDGYIESTKGFLLNGRPVGTAGLVGGSQPLYTEGLTNNFFGSSAGSYNTTGTLNAFFGGAAGRNNTTGSENSFFGASSGYQNVDGTSNSFFGYYAGNSNTTGDGNAFFGSSAGYANEVGNYNSFFGSHAGHVNLFGNYNSFFGYQAGWHNLASYNSFFGTGAGYSTTSGNWNSFFGNDTGKQNTTGFSNSFFGGLAGYSNTIGGENSASGLRAGYSTTTGFYNTFLGSHAGNSNTVEHRNTLVGSYADLDPGPNPATNPIDSATAIGHRAFVARSDSLVLGGVKGFNGATEETFVGIGTPSPDRQLVVEGSQAIGKFRRYNETGSDFGPAFLFERGRGTNTAPLDIRLGDYLGKVQFRGRVGGNMLEYGALVFIASGTNQDGRFSFVDRDLVTERMVVLNTGNIGIGTTAPTEILDVNGNLRVRGNILYGAPAIPVPDYVFDPNYRLMPISELERYLRTERHLPGISSAAEIQQNGVNLGEFQMKLLEKIEELTVYTVEQVKANGRLEEEAAMLKQRAASQEERIRTLEETVRMLLDTDRAGK